MLREGSKCADKLAKLEGKQSERMVCMLVPPEELIEDLRVDQMGTAFERGMYPFVGPHIFYSLCVFAFSRHVLLRKRVKLSSPKLLINIFLFEKKRLIKVCPIDEPSQQLQKILYISDRLEVGNPLIML